MSVDEYLAAGPGFFLPGKGSVMPVKSARSWRPTSSACWLKPAPLPRSSRADPDHTLGHAFRARVLDPTLSRAVLPASGRGLPSHAELLPVCARRDRPAWSLARRAARAP